MERKQYPKSYYDSRHDVCAKARAAIDMSNHPWHRDNEIMFSDIKRQIEKRRALKFRRRIMSSINTAT